MGCRWSADSNVALASAGAVSSASSTLAGYPLATVNDNERAGVSWSQGRGGWADATPDSYPDSVQINFNGSKSIDRVVVYTLQDNYTSPVEPTDSQTFSLYGIKDFTVEGRSGGQWVPLATVSNNTLVKRTVTFAAFTTDAIRIIVTNALASYVAHHRDRGVGGGGGQLAGEHDDAGDFRNSGGGRDDGNLHGDGDGIEPDRHRQVSTPMAAGR